MTRHFLILAACAALAACQPVIPDSGARLSNGVVNPGRGVGFDNSIEQQRAREAAQFEAAVPVTQQPLRQSGSALAPSRPASPTSAAAAAAAQSTDQELAAIAQRNDQTAATLNSGEAVVNASPSNAPPPIIDNPGISNEADFNAVSARRSIEGDAQLRAQNQAQYQVVQPTDLPSRTSSGPNIVQYALSTRHPVGQQVHRRNALTSAARTQRACAEYRSDNDAQAAFLARGRPQRDRLRLDPDGDGYACGWNPAPFRAAAGG